MSLQYPHETTCCHGVDDWQLLYIQQVEAVLQLEDHRKNLNRPIPVVPLSTIFQPAAGNIIQFLLVSAHFP